ncbi:MAG: 2-amino-4-hydroxy-6-hydroxymethyldihydropteridine diphosphokinase, partial [Fusobacteriaceae bacterium]|nr:2-amino-4-hydroxy-6-hydroxymethyldihydropteridine diphosphokinase [Fusobacteriaceae bacterium]
MSRVYLSLGSNMGDSFFYLLNAISKLDKLDMTKVTKVSKFYKTKAWGYKEQDDFINCCVEIETKLLPYKLLSEINEIESKLQRVRELHWGPRTIDIDIIFYDDLIIESEKLTIPHKYYKQRNFVLVPLLDIIWDKKQIIKYIDKKSFNDLEEYKYPKKIGISACLLGDNIKYNGGNNYTKLYVQTLKLDYLKVCPETLVGLPIPRVPSEIKGDKVFSKIGDDLSEEFEVAANKTLERIK